MLISLAELEHFLRVSCSEMMDAAKTTVDLSKGPREAVVGEKAPISAWPSSAFSVENK